MSLITYKYFWDSLYLFLCSCRLDLDQWINEPPSDSSDEDIQGANIFGSSVAGYEHRSTYQTESKKYEEPTEEELEIVSMTSST